MALTVERAETPLPVLDRMSGLPLGLPAAEWPACEECGRPMAFIGQLAGVAEAGVVYAFLCQNPATTLDCHKWAVEPGLRRIARVVTVSGPLDLGAFTPAPSALPEAPRPGLVARRWAAGEDELPEVDVETMLLGLHQTRPRFAEADAPDDEDDEWIAEDTRAARERARLFTGLTKVGGAPTWLQDPWFQTDPGHPARYRYRAQWSDYAAAVRGFFALPWVTAERERARRTGARFVDSAQRLEGRSVTVRVFADATYALLDGAMVRNEPDCAFVQTSLDAGRLYLLDDTLTGGLELYYIAR